MVQGCQSCRGEREVGRRRAKEAETLERKGAVPSCRAVHGQQLPCEAVPYLARGALAFRNGEQVLVGPKHPEGNRQGEK
eukprot:scaffold1143_cov162-Pinguiococcus_pyrenoidosus.AAC.1